MCFIIYFNFIYIWLSQSHNVGRKFSRVIQVDLCHFFCLISIRLSRFHDSNHGFDGLNQLTWVIFFIYPSLKLVKQYGKHYNKLNKSQQDKILLIKNLWVRWKSLEKNIIELWVNECINLHVNNIECRYKPYIKMHKFLTRNGEKQENFILIMVKILTPRSTFSIIQ